MKALSIVKKRLKKTVEVIQTNLIQHFMKQSPFRELDMGWQARGFYRVKNKKQGKNK